MRAPNHYTTTTGIDRIQPSFYTTSSSADSFITYIENMSPPLNVWNFERDVYPKKGLSSLFGYSGYSPAVFIRCLEDTGREELFIYKNTIKRILTGRYSEGKKQLFKEIEGLHFNFFLGIAISLLGESVIEQLRHDDEFSIPYLLTERGDKIFINCLGGGEGYVYSFELGKYGQSTVKSVLNNICFTERKNTD